MSAPRSALADTSRHAFSSVRLSEVVGSRHNNFDLLRLLAAWAVLVSHSFAVLDQPEPLHQLGSTLGNVGVLIFFAVSGLLIRRSWEYDPSPRDFWIKRGLRLLPALATVGVLTAFVLGPLVTTSSPSAYFSSWQTWIYPVRLVLMFPFGAGLPGVFEDNRSPERSTAPCGACPSRSSPTPCWPCSAWPACCATTAARPRRWPCSAMAWAAVLGAAHAGRHRARSTCWPPSPSAAPPTPTATGSC